MRFWHRQIWYTWSSTFVVLALQNGVHPMNMNTDLRCLYVQWSIVIIIQWSNISLHVTCKCVIDMAWTELMAHSHCLWVQYTRPVLVEETWIWLYFWLSVLLMNQWILGFYVPKPRFDESRRSGGLSINFDHLGIFNVPPMHGMWTFLHFAPIVYCW